uniref:Uncharacterized protein n=1 Tax=Tetranychus urticae TaxID=32264 RepID=T1KYC5_TETUR
MKYLPSIIKYSLKGTVAFLNVTIACTFTFPAINNILMGHHQACKSRS